MEKTALTIATITFISLLGLAACDNDPNNNKGPWNGKSSEELKKQSQITYYEIDIGLTEINFIDSQGNKVKCFKSGGLSCFLMESRE